AGHFLRRPAFIALDSEQAWRAARFARERGRMQEQVTTRIRFCPWVFLVLICMIWPGWSGAQDNTASNQNTSDNPPARVARLSYLKGNVSFLRAGSTQWSQAPLNFPATTGDRIYTDEGARAELEVGP